MEKTKPDLLEKEIAKAIEMAERKYGRWNLEDDLEPIAAVAAQVARSFMGTPGALRVEAMSAAFEEVDKCYDIIRRLTDEIAPYHGVCSVPNCPVEAVIAEAKGVLP